MSLKRKRSDLDDSPVSSSSTDTTASAYPSSPSPMPQTLWPSQTPNGLHSFTNFIQYDATPLDPFFQPTRPMMNSRTRKRWRDNRPNEDTVHANTLQKLYNAQHWEHEAPTPPKSYSFLNWSTVPSQPSRSQTSLHTFWNISGPKPQSGNPVEVRFPDTGGADTYLDQCEDCDGYITNDDTMDLDGLGDGAASSAACISCGKNVCNTCAVVRDARFCIQCASAMYGLG